MPKNPDGCQPFSYQNLSIDLVALLDFEFSVMVSFFLIDICAAPRTNTDAVFDLFEIGETPRCAWTQWICCGLNYIIILIKLRYLDLLLMQEKQVWTWPQNSTEDCVVLLRQVGRSECIYWSDRLHGVSEISNRL